MVSVNRLSEPKIVLLGQDKTPVIIIDNYVENYDEVAAQANEFGDFKPDQVTNYPGVRAAMPKAVVVDYLKPLMQLLYGVYKFPDTYEPTPKDNYFSLITCKPNELTAMQSWPHFDTPNPNLIAVIHYLNNGCHGGTGFFRHNKSGLDCIDNKNKDIYFQFADDYFHSLAAESYNYCSEQHSEFTCYQQIEYKPNRLLIFPGQLLHSTLVDLKTDINSNPQTGRLTANMFIVFK